MESLSILGKANFKSLGNSAKKAVLELIRSELVTSIAPALIPTLFPINAIYSIMDPNFNPNVAWAASGTRWERLPDNYVLWTSSNPTAGNVDANKIAAGLPNITGRTQVAAYNISNMIFTDGQGAFTGINTGYQVGVLNTNLSSISTNAPDTLTLDANKSNSIYRDDINTVQPPAIKYCAWRRVS